MKVCNKCKTSKDYSEFKASIYTSDGYFNACKKCTKSYKKRVTKKSIVDNLNKIIKATKKIENRELKKDGKKICSGCEKIIASSSTYCNDCLKIWNINNKEKRKEYYKEYKEKNKDKILEYAKQYVKERRKKEKEENKDYKEIQAKRMREYYALNKEKMAKIQRDYYYKKKLEKENKTDVTS
jgi:hypothetical protein